jgi:hypothetical protein
LQQRSDQNLTEARGNRNRCLNHHHPRGSANKNFFAPLRAASTEEESSSTEESTQEETPAIRTVGRPPIVITATTKLLQLQKAVKGLVESNYEFRSTRNGRKVIMKTLTDFAAVKSYLETRHLPFNTPAQDISERLMVLGFVIISVK